MRPDSIISFERFFLAALVVQTINSALSLEAAVKIDPGVAEVGIEALIAGMAIGPVISLFLWFFVAHRRSNIARWLVIGLTALSLLGLISSFPVVMAAGTLILTLTLLTSGLEIYALWCLFQADAVEWLAV